MGINDNDDDDQSSGLGDGIKKLFSAGISAAFMTEENIRSYLSELKLPKEVLNMVVQNANKSKDQLMKKVGSEISVLISKIDVVKELSQFAETHKFKVNAEIEFEKKNPNTPAESEVETSDSESKV